MTRWVGARRHQVTPAGVSGGGRTENQMIILGIVVLLLGLVLGVPILWTIGIVLVIVGIGLMILGGIGRPVAGRRHYY